MSGRIVALVALIAVCLVGYSEGRPPRAWRPTIEAAIDKTTCRVGETVTVTYRCSEGSTGCRANVTKWAMFVGKSDGDLIPLAGQYTFSPVEVGPLVTNITAYKRTLDLNGSGGPDGRRRTQTVYFEINALP